MISQEALKISTDQYLETVKWIRFIWGFRMAVMTGVVSAIGFSGQYDKYPELLFLLGAVVFFVDYACTLAIAPWVYSALYIENHIFPKSHHIVNNWNASFNVPVELADKENCDKQRRKFNKAYIRSMFKAKRWWYLGISFIILCVYAFSKDQFRLSICGAV